jgi:hypothetical protein
VENIAKNLQLQIGAMMDDNKKLRKDMKKVINSQARSASPGPL